MAAKNDITGDNIINKISDDYRNNFDLIFRKKTKVKENNETEAEVKEEKDSEEH